jgi:hypothetical protein
MTKVNLAELWKPLHGERAGIFMSKECPKDKLWIGTELHDKLSDSEAKIHAHYLLWLLQKYVLKMIEWIFVGMRSTMTNNMNTNNTLRLINGVLTGHLTYIRSYMRQLNRHFED